MYGNHLKEELPQYIAKLIEKWGSLLTDILIIFHRDQCKLLEWEAPIWLFRDMKEWARKFQRLVGQCFLQVDIWLYFIAEAS